MEAPPKIDPSACARAAALDDVALLAECDVQSFVASGPGGQHRNKTETGVRIRHRPTGLQVTATERRSQLMNRLAALERLRARLTKAAFVQKTRRVTKIPRSAKRRRLESKRHQSDKKRGRSGGEW